MAWNFLINRLKALVLVFIGVFRRALCCFRRRRRSSSCTPIPLTAVGVVPNSISANDREDGPELHSWNTWDDGSSPDSVVTDAGQSPPVSINSIQQQIELYRQSQIRQTNENETDQPAEDYFQDMTPRITKQPKVLVPLTRRGEGEGQESPGNGTGAWSSRLAVSTSTIPYPASSELEAWDETGSTGGGWDEAAGDEAWEQVRALRQARRAAEQQRRRREREGKSRLGARVGGTS